MCLGMPAYTRPHRRARRAVLGVIVDRNIDASVTILRYLAHDAPRLPRTCVSRLVRRFAATTWPRRIATLPVSPVFTSRAFAPAAVEATVLVPYGFRPIGPARHI